MTKAWSRAELRASVEAYLDMLDMTRHRKPFSKKDCYNKLSERFDRSAKAFEYRMQNISYVMTLLGREWVPGLKPAKNVGANVITEIQSILVELETENALREEPLQPYRVNPEDEPTGSVQEAQWAEVQRFARSQQVRERVLTMANGRCEACDSPAPFLGTDNKPFLEVHHVRPMAQQGSDSVRNTVALCPNCHREVHHSNHAQALIEVLYQRVRRLVRE